MCMCSLCSFHFPSSPLLPLLLGSSFLSSPPTDPFSVWWLVVEFGRWWIAGDGCTFSPLLSSTSPPFFPYANQSSHYLFISIFFYSPVLFVVLYLPSNVGYWRCISPHQSPSTSVPHIIMEYYYRTIIMMAWWRTHTHSYVTYLSHTLS